MERRGDVDLRQNEYKICILAVMIGPLAEILLAMLVLETQSLDQQNDLS